MKISHALHDWWIKERWIFYPFPNTRYYTFFIALFQLRDMSAVCALLNLYGSRRRFPPRTEFVSARSRNLYPQYKVKDVRFVTPLSPTVDILSVSLLPSWADVEPAPDGDRSRFHKSRVKHWKQRRRRPRFEGGDIRRGASGATRMMTLPSLHCLSCNCG